MGKKNKKKGNEAVAGTPASTAAAYMESAGRMHTLARKYPWFDGAVIASADGDRYALPVHILLLKSFRPSFILHTGSATGKSAADEPVADKPVEERPTEKEHVAGEPTGETKSGSATIDIIDDFIDKGEHKVVATDDTPEFIPESNIDGNYPKHYGKMIVWRILGKQIGIRYRWKCGN